MKTIKELETPKHSDNCLVGLDSYGTGYKQALKDVLGLIDELREIFANLEHEQWMKWSKHIRANNSIPRDLLIKWEKNWKPYSELDEKTKDYDRVWADKIIEELKARINGK